jgi:hypothetical protein
VEVGSTIQAGIPYHIGWDILDDEDVGLGGNSLSKVLLHWCHPYDETNNDDQYDPQYFAIILITINLK